MAVLRGAHSSRVLAVASPPPRTLVGKRFRNRRGLLFGCGFESSFRRDAETSTRDECAPQRRRRGRAHDNSAPHPIAPSTTPAVATGLHSGLTFVNMAMPRLPTEAELAA